ncbi:hypothetical protein FVE85_4907 [Porphyridium purpureum]|uniref:Uncharacterized protein n=1 Tax=Porphyridium purpureum TaxID=35688 RepID=A0A5J4YS81_PORPP|nr:hypothetical protein FVE85_4907 [Porphyridium purpureum]|eukprot:POR5138..scf236_6
MLLDDVDGTTCAVSVTTAGAELVVRIVSIFRSGSRKEHVEQEAPPSGTARKALPHAARPRFVGIERSVTSAPNSGSEKCMPQPMVMVWAASVSESNTHFVQIDVYELCGQFQDSVRDHEQQRSVPLQSRGRLLLQLPVEILMGQVAPERVEEIRVAFADSRHAVLILNCTLLACFEQDGEQIEWKLIWIQRNPKSSTYRNVVCSRLTRYRRTCLDAHFTCLGCAQSISVQVFPRYKEAPSLPTKFFELHGPLACYAQNKDASLLKVERLIDAESFLIMTCESHVQDRRDRIRRLRMVHKASGKEYLMPLTGDWHLEAAFQSFVQASESVFCMVFSTPTFWMVQVRRLPLSEVVVERAVHCHAPAERIAGAFFAHESTAEMVGVNGDSGLVSLLKVDISESSRSTSSAAATGKLVASPSVLVSAPSKDTLLSNLEDRLAEQLDLLERARLELDRKDAFVRGLVEGLQCRDLTPVRDLFLDGLVQFPHIPSKLQDHAPSGNILHSGHLDDVPQVSLRLKQSSAVVCGRTMLISLVTEADLNVPLRSARVMLVSPSRTILTQCAHVHGPGGFLATLEIASVWQNHLHEFLVVARWMDHDPGAGGNSESGIGTESRLQSLGPLGKLAVSTDLSDQFDVIQRVGRWRGRITLKYSIEGSDEMHNLQNALREYMKLRLVSFQLLATDSMPAQASQSSTLRYISATDRRCIAEVWPRAPDTGETGRSKTAIIFLTCLDSSEFEQYCAALLREGASPASCMFGSSAFTSQFEEIEKHRASLSRALQSELGELGERAVSASQPLLSTTVKQKHTDALAAATAAAALGAPNQVSAKRFSLLEPFLF